MSLLLYIIISYFIIVIFFLYLLMCGDKKCDETKFYGKLHIFLTSKMWILLKYI